jgi:hypothetical protein
MRKWKPDLTKNWCTGLAITVETRDLIKSVEYSPTVGGMSPSSREADAQGRLKGNFYERLEFIRR